MSSASTSTRASFILDPSVTSRSSPASMCTLVPREDAELMVCSGLFDDDTETPDDYAKLLKELAARNLPMICANPDHLVERGDKLVYCAGEFSAAIYEQLGGNVV